MVYFTSLSADSHSICERPISSHFMAGVWNVVFQLVNAGNVEESDRALLQPYKCVVKISGVLRVDAVPEHVVDELVNFWFHNR